MQNKTLMNKVGNLKVNNFLIFFFLFLFYTGSVTSQVFQEQVIPGELPDASIIEVDEVYYATGSSNDWGPIYPIYQSKDLKNWTFLNYVFREKPTWTISSYWAPELFYHDGIFYCYYTAKRVDGTSMIGVATTKNISDGFKDHGELLEWGNEAIDAFVNKVNDTLYITWKAYGLDPDQPIQILGAKLSKDGLSLNGESFSILNTDIDSWEQGGMEGQSIVKNNGYLYMLYSGNACCGSSCDYQVGVARAKQMEGPWEKYGSNPILKGNETWKCPGHGTAIHTKNKWYYLYHAYNSKGFPYLGRVALLSEMKWDKITGWPSFIENVAKQTGYEAHNFADEFDTSTLNHLWKYDIPSYTIKYEIDKGQLRLYDEVSNTTNSRGAFIGVNPLDSDFKMNTKVITNNKALKGLALYATKDNSVGIGVKGNDLIVWKKKDGKLNVVEKLRLQHSKNIYLEANITKAHIVSFSYSYDGEKWISSGSIGGASGVIGDNLAWWSWGIKAGLFVNTASEAMENSAVFENFSITYD
tara:strand:- start:719 stop:2296 length:1578 start_codon:yes stop_codon:yes gene_type:complete